MMFKPYFLSFLAIGMLALGNAPQGHTAKAPKVSFYICAHQDDWQLFMGTNAFKDITAHEPAKPLCASGKVVFIYLTAGNLNDDDDRKTCDCHHPAGGKGKVPYWQVREAGARNSVHLAACRMGEPGPGYYPTTGYAHINGHDIARYEFKNTVSYFMRLKAGAYGGWYSNPQAEVGVMDNNTSYMGMPDLERTLKTIIKHEMSGHGYTCFHMPDVNEKINPNDHHDHIIAGRAGMHAVHMLARQYGRQFSVFSYIDYHTQKLLPNMCREDMQNEASLVAVYCLSLLDYNAWPEWGDDYRKWTTRNYYRVTRVGGR